RLIDDLIDTIRDGPTLRAENVGQALATGVELEGKLELQKLVNLQLNYTFLDARNRSIESGDAGNLLPGRPPHSVFLRCDVGHFGWRLVYEMDYTSLLYLDPANLQPRPARALHTLGLKSEPQGKARLTMSIEIRNLADTRSLPVTLPLSGGMQRQV